MIWINSLPPVLSSECLCSSSCWTLFCDELPHHRTRLSYPIEIIAKTRPPSLSSSLTSLPSHRNTRFPLRMPPTSNPCTRPPSTGWRTWSVWATSTKPASSATCSSATMNASSTWVPRALIHTEHANVYSHLQSNIKSFLLTLHRGSSLK